MKDTLKEIIKELVLEELRINISNEDLSYIDPEEKERLINAGYYNEDINLSNINDILIDYSDSDFTDSSLLEFINSIEFLRMIKTTRQYYLLKPIFNYLISSNDDYISTEAMAIFFKKFKDYFDSVTFIKNKYEYYDFSAPDKYFANVDKLYKPNTLDSIVFDMDKFRPDVIGKYYIYNTSKEFEQRVDFKELKGVYGNISDIKPIVALYLGEDVSNSTYTYMYNRLSELYDNELDEDLKNELKLLIDIIYNYGNYKIEGNFDIDAFNRILSKCDNGDLDLDDRNLNVFVTYFKKVNPKIQDVELMVKKSFSDYMYSAYNADYFEFIKQFNENNDIDFKEFFGGRGTKNLTPELLQSFSNLDNYPYLIDLMGNHKCTEKFIGNRRRRLGSFLNNERQENIRKTELLNKFQKNLEELANMEPYTMTIEYYAYNNINEEDRDDFLKIVNYYFRTNQLKEYNFSSYIAKRKVYDKIVEETINALNKGEFANYDQIVDRCSYLLDIYGLDPVQKDKKKFAAECNEHRIDVANNYLLRNIDDLKKCMNENNMFIAIYALNNKSIVEAIELSKSDNEEIKEIQEKYLRDQKAFYEELKEAGIINFNILDFIHILNVYLESKESFYKEVSYIVLDDGKVNNNYYLIVSNFVNGDYTTKESYLNAEKIPLSVFNKALEFCNQNHPDLIREYEDKLQKLAKQRFYPIIENAKGIVYGILYGIDYDDGTHRDFDYLDFKLATKMEVKDFIKFIKEKKIIKNRDDFIKVIRWLKPKEEVLHFSYNQVRSTKYVINGVELTDEMKEEIFDYLKEKNIGNDLRAFNIIVRKYLNGEMTINGKGINSGDQQVTK